MKNKLNIYIFIGFIVGILGGLFLPNLMSSIDFIGNIYINLLKFIIIPVLFTTISVSIYKNTKSKLLLKTIILFVVMFISVFLVSSFIVYIVRPFLQIDLKVIENTVLPTTINISDFFLNIFPSNPIDIIAKNNIIFIILFASFFGYSASKVKKGKEVIEFIETISSIFNKLLEYIINLTPLAVFSLIGTSVSVYGVNILSNALIYVVLAYVISILIIFLFLIIMKKRIKPVQYLKNMSKLWVISLSTCSSVATLPYTLKTCKEDLNLNKENVDLIVPLGTTINKIGGAISFAILSIWTTKLFGIEINAMMFITMILISLLLNMAAVGIPSGGIVLGATYLSMLGIPLSFMGVYSAIYRLLDMAYTTLNVTGNVNASILLEVKEKA